jgi:hypothetical protein
MAESHLRQRIGQQILDITAGHPSQEALCAQADALATGLGGIAFLSGMTLEAAKQTLKVLHEEMQQHLSENWGTVDRGDH